MAKSTQALAQGVINHYSGHFFDEVSVLGDVGGSLVLAGTALPESSFDIAAIRIGEDGSLDPSFGESGQAAVNFATTILPAILSDFLVLSDGRIMSAGRNGLRDGLVTRHLPSGQPDFSFGLMGNHSSLQQTVL